MVFSPLKPLNEEKSPQKYRFELHFPFFGWNHGNDTRQQGNGRYEFNQLVPLANFRVFEGQLQSWAKERALGCVNLPPAAGGSLEV